jgi:hypothetical protein
MFEHRFKAEQKQLMLADLDLVHRRHIDVSKSTELGRAFFAIYGGTTTDSVLQYLAERISFLYPPGIAPEGVFLERGQQENRTAVPAPPVNMATNYSMPLWSASLRRPDAQAFLVFNDKQFPILSSRIGAVQLGEGFFDREFHNHTTPVSRFTTLVHEARHSDCEGGLDRADVDRIRAGKQPANRACGHAHSRCAATIKLPDGSEIPHPYAGSFSCESVPWGAYAVSWIFSAAVARDCEDCDEAERQEAAALAIDSKLRLGDMFERGMPAPDMSSQGVRNE